MKLGFVIVALTIGLLAALMPVPAPAGDGGSADRAGTDPEQTLAPWSYRSPVETGALPDMSGSGAKSSAMASGDAGFTVVEIGNVQYRHGLDTGP